MSISPYVERLRTAVGTNLLLLPGVAAIIRDEEGRILLHRRADDGQWSLPAGAIDPGETPAQAIVREVREEVGLEATPTVVLAVLGGPAFRHVYPNGDETEYTVVVFGCSVSGGKLEARDGEATELRFFPPEEVPRLGLEYPAELFADPERREALI